MKFGRNLARNQVPEWASSYINYKGLKKYIKNAAEGSEEGGEPDLAGFFHALDRNLEDVDHFYNKKYQDFSRRMKLLEDRYGFTQAAVVELEAEDREDLLGALLELRGQLRKLQWYGEVNRRGFIKITKKLDKKVPKASAQKKYLALKVDPSAFATNSDLFVSLNKINDWMSLLSEATSASTTENDLILAPSATLKRTTSRQSLQIPQEIYNLLEQQVRQDDTAGLEKALEEVRGGSPGVSDHVYQQLLKGLLQRAIFARSRNCIKDLLQQIVFLDDADDINRRNCVHRLVVSIGRVQASKDRELQAQALPDAESELYSFLTPATSPSNPFKPNVPQEEQKTLLTREHDQIVLLQFLLDNFQTTHRSALMSRDVSGRTPLHFAAEFGVPVVCEILVDHLHKWKLLDLGQGIDGPKWQDNEGWTPLHLSAMGGHPRTTQVLLNVEKMDGQVQSRLQVRQTSAKTAAVLALATKANFVEVVRILVEFGVDLNYQDEQGECALHIAARFGHTDCAKLMLMGNQAQKANTELAEVTYGWTPLFIACVDGQDSIVDLLIDAGTDLERPDLSGWTAKEHAALRGHMKIARRLAEVTSEPDPESSSSSVSSTSPPASTSLVDRTSNGLGTATPPTKTNETFKSFGHRYLTDKAMILVSLGTMDMRRREQAVQLDNIPLAHAHSTQLDTALSLIVSAKSADGEPEVIDLPVQDNISTEPIVFHATDPSKVKLLFDLVPTYSGNHEKIVGRGVAFLSSIKTSLGSQKMSLQGDIVVPVIAAGDLEVIGSVTFNFLIITPFKHPNMTVNENQTYWKSMASTMVIGHRGLGKNIAGRRSLQLGENTIQSFISAANLGASYVEFDIQLTKDYVPVIYHDFLVSETGIDAPVHTLTLEQFLHVNDSRTPRPSRPASPVPFENPKVSNLRGGGEARPLPLRHRSMSMGGADNDSIDMDERMKHTRDFKKKGFKGNSRGTSIQSPFATLEELFRKLPTNVGFNMEMKYPILSECEDEDMDHYAMELNKFVDTVLDKVYELGKGRNLIFSSFNPDVCLLLNFKQPSIPVLFLTEAGTSPMGDIRATSIQEAIRFTSRWNLLGLVSAAEPFVIAPRLVRVVKESGLVCVSYGTLNNDNDNVRLQVKQGIDAVIVDSVLNIRKGLTENAAAHKHHKDEINSNNGIMKNTGPMSASTESLNVVKVILPEKENPGQQKEQLHT